VKPPKMPKFSKNNVPNKILFIENLPLDCSPSTLTPIFGSCAPPPSLLTTTASQGTLKCACCRSGLGLRLWSIRTRRLRALRCIRSTGAPLVSSRCTSRTPRSEALVHCQSRYAVPVLMYTYPIMQVIIHTLLPPPPPLQLLRSLFNRSSKSASICIS
jgi:RNA recognition motif-containing protein